MLIRYVPPDARRPEQESVPAASGVLGATYICWRLRNRPHLEACSPALMSLAASFAMEHYVYVIISLLALAMALSCMYPCTRTTAHERTAALQHGLATNTNLTRVAHVLDGTKAGMHIMTPWATLVAKKEVAEQMTPFGICSGNGFLESNFCLTGRGGSRCTFYPFISTLLLLPHISQGLGNRTVSFGRIMQDTSRSRNRRHDVRMGKSAGQKAVAVLQRRQGRKTALAGRTAGEGTLDLGKEGVVAGKRFRARHYDVSHFWWLTPWSRGRKGPSMCTAALSINCGSRTDNAYACLGIATGFANVDAVGNLHVTLVQHRKLHVASGALDYGHGDYRLAGQFYFFTTMLIDHHFGPTGIWGGFHVRVRAQRTEDRFHLVNGHGWDVWWGICTKDALYFSNTTLSPVTASPQQLGPDVGGSGCS